MTIIESHAARDELAELIGRTMNSEFLDPSGKTAEAVLAAGYQKSQQVTTAEELDALPVGSVVLSRGRSWQRYNPEGVGIYQYHDWQCPDGGFVDGSYGLHLILPATVLHVGAAL